VVCWGSNTSGQLGDGTTDPSSIPVTVSGLSDAIDISVGVATSCALRAAGEVACWGNNLDGQLGDGTYASSPVPVPVLGIDDAIQVSVAAGLVCIVRATGAMRCFGEGREGQLGNALPGTAIPVAAATLPDL
jgi:alpha-tubulin suppressor-like RCC1 family protein